jgi:hypothetical protein
LTLLTLRPRRRLALLCGCPTPTRSPSGDGSKLLIEDGCFVTPDLGGNQISDTYLVLEKSVEDLVIGESTMHKAGVKLDMENHAIYCVLKATAGENIDAASLAIMKQMGLSKETFLKYNP